MAATKYTYSISGDFPNAKVATDKLSDQIEASSIATALDCINTHGDDCDIWFEDALSGADQTTLDGVVAAHDGEPYELGGYGESDAEETTTSTEYQRKLRLSGDYAGGLYYVEWYCEIMCESQPGVSANSARSASDNSAGKIALRIRMDESDVLAETAWLPDSESGCYAPDSGFKRVTIAGGNHMIDMDFAATLAGQTVAMRNARMRLVGAE